MILRLGLTISLLAIAACVDSTEGPLEDEGTTSAGGSNNDNEEEEGGAPGPDPSEGSSTFGPGDSTGGIDENTTFGMGDDMPLVADIRDIKRGLLDERFVMIGPVPAISQRATLDGETWFYVQDPTLDEYMGLRITIDQEMDPPDFDHALTLVGTVRYAEAGWTLDLEDVLSSRPHEGVAPIVLEPVQLLGSSAAHYDDALVEIDAEVGLELVEEGKEAGTVMVRDDESGEQLLVDLRPFALDGLPFEPGMRLQRLAGVAEIFEGQVTLLPRSSGDFLLVP